MPQSGGKNQSKNNIITKNSLTFILSLVFWYFDFILKCQIEDPRLRRWDGSFFMSGNPPTELPHEKLTNILTA